MNPRDARALRLKPQDRVDVVSRRGRVRERRAARHRDHRARPGVRAVPLRRGQRQPGDAERVRSDLARAELQAVGGAGRAPTRRDERSGAVDGRRAGGVGNGMAGMACVEQILKYAPQFRHHRLRRRDARQLQPRACCRRCSPARRRADDIVINPLEWYQQQRHRPARRRAHRRRRCRGEDRHRRRRQRHAVRHAAAGDRQLARGCRRSTGSTRTACSCSARSTTRASCSRASGPGTQGGGHRRRAARPRGGARAAGAGLRRHRRAPDADADGAAARSRTAAGTWSAKMEELGIRVLLGRQHDGHSRQRPRRGRGALGRQRRSKPISSSWRPASGRTSTSAARPASPSTAASSSTTTWRRPTPTSSPSASASSIAASATGWWRRSSSRARCWRRRSPGNRGPDLYRHRAGGQAQDHGRRRLLGRRLERAELPSRCATRIRALGVYKKLTRARRQAGRRDPRRRHLRQPSLHGLAAHRRRSDGAAAAPAVSAAGRRRRPRRRRDGRQRHRLRLRRRDQGHHHPGHPRAAASTRCRSSRSARARAPAAAAAPACARTCCAPSRRTSRRRRRR